MKLNYESGRIPTKYELTVGQIAYNVPDGIQYTKLIDGTVVVVGANHGIESGHTDVGSYTKFPDGTLIQRGVYVSEATKTIIKLMLPFINTEYSVSTQFSSGDTRAFIGALGSNISPYILPITTRRSTTEEATAGITVRWMAVGRWKK